MQQSHKQASYTVHGVTKQTVQSSLAGLGCQGGDLVSQRADSATEGALPQHPHWWRTARLWWRRAYRLQGGKWCQVALWRVHSLKPQRSLELNTQPSITYLVPLGHRHSVCDRKTSGHHKRLFSMN